MNYTTVVPGSDYLLTFRHSISADNGYGWERSPYPDCTKDGNPVEKVWYPSGQRLNPNTMNLSNVITEITTVPVGLVLPDVIKISNDTRVSWDNVGQILRPEEDAQYYEKCGYVSGAQEQDKVNRLS